MSKKKQFPLKKLYYILPQPKTLRNPAPTVSTITSRNKILHQSIYKSMRQINGKKIITCGSSPSHSDNKLFMTQSVRLNNLDIVFPTFEQTQNNKKFPARTYAKPAGQIYKNLYQNKKQKTKEKLNFFLQNSSFVSMNIQENTKICQNQKQFFRMSTTQKSKRHSLTSPKKQAPPLEETKIEGWIINNRDHFHSMISTKK